MTDQGAQPGEPARTMSWRGVLIGLVVAFILPAGYRILAALVENGIAPYDQVHAQLDLLGTISLAELLLGPLGIVVAGRAARLRGGGPWFLWLLVTVPLVTFAWFVAVLTLSGTLGNPL